MTTIKFDGSYDGENFFTISKGGPITFNLPNNMSAGTTWNIIYPRAALADVADLIDEVERQEKESKPK